MEEQKYEKFYPKLQKTVSGTYFVTLRKEVVDAKGWEENQAMECLVKEKE